MQIPLYPETETGKIEVRGMATVAQTCKLIRAGVVDMVPEDAGTDPAAATREVTGNEAIRRTILLIEFLILMQYFGATTFDGYWRGIPIFMTRPTCF